jgi:hypothetical protein
MSYNSSPYDTGGYGPDKPDFEVYTQNPQNPQNLQNPQNPQNLQNPQNFQNPQNLQNPQNPQPYNNSLSGECLEVGWQATFAGCQSVHAPESREINPIPSRYRVADLNPLYSERSMMAGREWNPYKHFDSRQLFAQFLWKDVRSNGDPYSKPV